MSLLFLSSSSLLLSLLLCCCCRRCCCRCCCRCRRCCCRCCVVVFVVVVVVVVVVLVVVVFLHECDVYKDVNNTHSGSSGAFFMARKIQFVRIVSSMNNSKNLQSQLRPTTGDKQLNLIVHLQFRMQSWRSSKVATFVGSRLTTTETEIKPTICYGRIIFFLCVLPTLIKSIG